MKRPGWTSRGVGWSGFVALLLVGAVRTHAAVVFEGRIDSAALQTQRMVRIYTPPAYDREPGRRFPVLYVHDGQNAFSTVGTNVAFGWGSWDLDRTATALSQAGRMDEIVIVAVDCTADRYGEYRGRACPRPGEGAAIDPPELPPAPGDDGAFEAYGRFLMEELKPKIDREYRTRSGPADTALLGSSLGGLCSLTLAWEHPGTFGKAASLSGSFQVERTNFLARLVGALGQPRPMVRFYLDSGAVSMGGGDDGRVNTTAVAEALRRQGWRDGADLLHYVDANPMTGAELEQAGLRADKRAEARTNQHNEFYWRQRVWRALVFLFPPTRGSNGGSGHAVGDLR